MVLEVQDGYWIAYHCQLTKDDQSTWLSGRKDLEVYQGIVEVCKPCFSWGEVGGCKHAESLRVIPRPGHFLLVLNLVTILRGGVSIGESECYHEHFACSSRDIFLSNRMAFYRVCESSF